MLVWCQEENPAYKLDQDVLTMSLHRLLPCPSRWPAKYFLMACSFFCLLAVLQENRYRLLENGCSCRHVSFRIDTYMQWVCDYAIKLSAKWGQFTQNYQLTFFMLLTNACWYWKSVTHLLLSPLVWLSIIN